MSEAELVAKTCATTRTERKHGQHPGTLNQTSMLGSSGTPVEGIDMSLEGIVCYQPLRKWQQSHRVHMSCKFSPAPRGACARQGETGE